MDGSSGETKRLQRHVESALRRALDPAAVLPLLHRLSRLAPAGTAESVYAQRRLAELLADAHPWRAALHAKRVLAVAPADDRAWSILALCLALLGHFKAAAHAYRRALDVAPGNPAYAHNLGHLIDVALDRPAAALPWLRVAYEGSREKGDVAVSFAHALARAGELDEAKRVASHALQASESAGHSREHRALVQWLEQGAPSAGAILPRCPPARVAAPSWKRRAARDSEATPPALGTGALESALQRGVASLPFNREQRERVRALGRDPWVVAALQTEGMRVSAMAASLAYAIVFVDHIPLTQGEVAGCFRVSLQALRGLFKALRAHLDLTPGDARYATVHPRG